MRRLSWVLAGLGLVVAALVIIMASPQAKAWQIGDTYSGSGDWTISNPTSVGDESVTVTGNLVVNSQLTMHNARIYLDSGTTDGLRTVNIPSGGTLNVWGGSTISAASGTYHYKFTVYGTLDVNASTVSEMWGDLNSWVGGIQVYSNGVTIRGASSITLGETGGVYVLNQAVSITGSSIYGNGGSGNTNYCYGIYISSSGTTASTINNNLIYNNNFVSGSNYYGYGIYSVGLTSADQITNTRIWNNGGGASVYNYGTQLYLSGSSPTLVNIYLGNGTYGLYADNSYPPTIVSMTVNSYTYNMQTYGVYAYNSALKFQGCDFTTTYISSTQYAVFAYGPNSGSASSLDFTWSNFTYTQTGSYQRYFIYTGSGYTPVNMTTCRVTSTSGSNVYVVYANDYCPIKIASSTFTVSTTQYATYAVYASNYCPVNITWSSITFTNAAQYLSSSSTYMIYGSSNCPVTVSNSILTQTITGVSGYSYPYFYMIYATSTSPVQVSASTMNMAVAGTLGYPYYAYYYHVYASSYCPVTVSDSWLNLTSSSMSYYPYTYDIYANSYCPVIVNNTRMLTTITTPQTGSNLYLYQIYTSYYCPITLSGDTMTVTVTSCPAQYAYIYQLNTNSYSQISMDNCTLLITGSFTASRSPYIYQIYASSYCPIQINYSNINITGTSSNTYPYYYQIYVSSYCPVYIRNSIVSMAYTTSTSGYNYHYEFYASNYCHFFIDNSTINFMPRSTNTGSGANAYYYLFNFNSYCNLVFNYSTYNYIPYSANYWTYGYLGQSMTYSKMWVNYSVLNIAPQYGGYYYQLYGWGYSATNYMAVDILGSVINIVFPTAGASPYYCYFYYTFYIYSSSGQNSHFTFNDSTWNMLGATPYQYAYMYYSIYVYYYCPIYINNSYLNCAAYSTSGSGYCYAPYQWVYGYQYCPLRLTNFQLNFNGQTTAYAYYCYYPFYIYYPYSENYIENVSFNVVMMATYCYFYYSFNLYYYTYSQNHINNVTWNVLQSGSSGAYFIMPIYVYYSYGFNNVTNITLNVNLTSSGGNAQYQGLVYGYYYYSLDVNNVTANIYIWAGTYAYYYYGIVYAYALKVNVTNLTVNAYVYSASNYLYCYYPCYLYNTGGWNRLENWNIKITMLQATGIIYVYYPFYIQSNSPTNITNVTMDMSGTTLSNTSQSLYVNYFFYPGSNCPTNVRKSVFNLSFSSYQPQVTISYATSNSQLSFDDCTLNISVNAYVQNSGSYLYTLRGLSSSNLQLNRTTVRVTNTTVTNYYGIRGETGSAVLFNGSTYHVENLITPQTSYHIYGAGVTWVGSTFSVVNETGNTSITQAKLLYYFYLLDGNSYITDANFRFDVQSTGYACQYYGFWVQGSGTARAFVMKNTNVSISTNNAIMGGWLLWVQTFNDVSISGCNFKVAQVAPVGSLFAAQGDGGGRIFGMDNCTVDYQCLVSQTSPGGYIWGFMTYTTLFCNNTYIYLHNDAGVYPLYLFTGFNFGSAYFSNTNIDFRLGGGTLTVPTDVVLANNLGYINSFNFARSNLNVTVQGDPVNFKGFSFYNGVSTALNFDASAINININAPGSTATFITFEANIGEPPSLQTLSCTNTTVNMVVSRENGAIGMLKMASGTQMQNFLLSNSQLTFTMSMSSVQTSNIIWMDGVKSGLYKNLAVTVNAPNDATTRFVGIMMTRSFPTFDNFQIKTNRQGRVIDIWADMASMPVITNTTLDYGDIGIMSTVFANPSVSYSSITNFKTGIAVDNFGNITLQSTSVSQVDTAVALTNNSYASMYDSSLNPTTTAIDLNQGSTAWLLNTTWAGKSIQFRDSQSWFIVNWWLQLKVQWRGGDIIPNALVVLNDTNAREYLRGTSNAGGIIPYFTVVQYTQTGAGGAVRKDFSPYSASVSFGGFTASRPNIVTDKSQEVVIDVVDDVPPALTVILPEDNILRNFTTVELAGLASDVGAGLGDIKFSYKVGDAPEVQVASTKAFPAWTYTMELPEGDNIVITVTLSDMAGNTVSDTRHATIDLTAPSIRVDSPADQSLTNVINQDIKGAVAADSVIFTINYRPVEFDAEGKFSFPIRLVEGTNRYSFFAKDRAGNTNTGELTLFLDITPPPVTVVTPADGLLTNKDKVTVSGFTEAGAVLTVNGAPVDVWTDGSFSSELALVRGINTITVLSSDAAGNQMRAVRTVLMDNELALDIRTPAENMVTNQITILVMGSADPDALLRLNDAVVSIALDGNFTITYTLGEGQNELVFKGIDRAGNTAQVIRHVVLDTTLPWIDLTAPEAGKIYKTNTLTVKGTCEAGISLTVNGLPAATDTGSFSIELANVREGQSVIRVVGSDGAGNIVVAERQVIVDSTAPTIEVVEPQDGFRTQDRIVNVVGVTEPGAAVTVNGMAVAVDEFGKFATAVTLRDGKNTITIKATDAAGNNAQDKTFSVRSTPAVAGQQASTGWMWTVVGVLVALGIGFPLTMLYLKIGLRERRREG